MYIKVSWDKEFEELMLYLKLKYKDKMFNADGIGDDTLDLNKFSKSFFTNNTTTADVSVDSNSNVTAKTSVEYTFELPKPLKRLNSYFLLWKQLKKQFDIDFANKVIEMQLCGDIYINDFTDIAMPYSYHPGTTIILRKKNDPECIIHTTMESLFKQYEIYSIKQETYEEIDLKPFNFEIYEEYKWVSLERVLRHITDKCLYRFESKYGNVFTVTSDHPCILSDDSEKYAEDVKVNVGRHEVEFEKYIDDADFIIEVKDVPTIQQLTINCAGKDIEIDAVRLINEEIDSIISDLKIETQLKEKIANIVFSDMSIRKKRIEIRKLRKDGLKSLFVRMFIKLLEYIAEI